MRKDISNLTFGHLLVVKFLGNLPVGKQGKTRGKWECKCICGNTNNVYTGALISGNTTSCGCRGNRIGDTKKCSKCKIFLKINNFYKWASQCKKCVEADRKKRYDSTKISDRYHRNLTESQIIDNRLRSKKYRDNNLEKCRERTRKWRSENPNYKKEKWKNDLNYRIKENLRGRIYKAVKNNSKSKSTSILIGCTVDDLKNHLENQFTEGMTWDNYGEWHIDHIKPCSLFNLTIESEQEECFNYNNLQPLWAKDNLSKSNKYE